MLTNHVARANYPKGWLPTILPYDFSTGDYTVEYDMAKIDQNLTQEKLKKHVHYCPDTGEFRWTHTFRFGQGVPRKLGEKATIISSEYLHVCIDAYSYPAHRLAYLYMTGEWPGDQVDHENRDKQDNRWENLRSATRAENLQNQRIYKNNKSGYHGVGWNNQCKKWRASITCNKKMHYLGLFEHKEDAIEARRLAELFYGFHENHGEAI